MTSGPAQTRMLSSAQVLLWRALALVALVLGAIGLVLPIVPTVPFWILAAWAAGKGWPALQRWLENHPRIGPPIRDWRERGAVPRRAKWLASGMMLVSAIMLQFTSAPAWAKVAVPTTMFAVAVWMWRRPD